MEQSASGIAAGLQGRDWSKAVVYSEAFKAKMVKKMIGPNAKTAGAVAEEVGMSQPTLSRWLREAGSVESMSKKSQRKRKSKSKVKTWTTEEKLRVVVAAASASEDELGALLRREGVHQAQLDEWREAANEALTGGVARKRKKASEEARKIKALERELRRKEKALAEVSALLVLKKKVDALWGGEDDDTTERSEK